MVDTPFSRKHVLLLLAMAAVAIMLDSFGMGVTSIAAKRRNILVQTETLARESIRNETIAIAEAELENWLPSCLPGDPARSTNIYQQALLLHAADIGVEDIIVQPGVPEPVRNVGYRIPCQITATMAPLQLGAYLDRIYGMELMQKVTRLDVVNASKLRNSRSSDLKRIVMKIEAIGMQAAKDREAIASHPTSTSLKQLFQQKRLFTRDVPPAIQTLSVANTTKPAVTRKPLDPLFYVRYVASFSQRGEWQAWLYDERTKEQYTVTQGDRIVAGERSLHVLAIGEDSVEVEVDRVAARIELGQLLISKQLPAM